MDHSEHMQHMADTPMSNGGHAHGSAGSSNTCKMNMIFTWNSDDLCIVFDWWHIQTFAGFLISLVAVAGLSMGYEFLRTWISSKEAVAPEQMPAAVHKREDELKHQNSEQRLFKALTYGLQIAYSFFLMLVFMTYNGWVMLAVVAGAIAGNYLWSAQTSKVASKGMFCH
ncbi:Ctr copper transporter family-domain-containing protein [Lipomyces oligophaga]|uniref:Ctr copper transporter family-domain-containing protein n=1 Tax=Lipomyces oligophaga TaxID=45792 RepID=UPI0034CE733F